VAQLFSLGIITPMKKLVVLGFVIALAVVCLLFWQHFKHPSDAMLSRQIAGPWTDGHYAKMTFVPDGSFSSTFGRPSNRVAFIGIWHIKEGVLIMTTTNSSGASAGPVGHVDQAKVIYLDAHRLVYKIGEQTISYNRTWLMMPNTAPEPTATAP
jgi:hypothetical protein